MEESAQKHNRLQVLDLGYLELIECWGSDEAIVSGARMSTGGGFVSWEPYDGHPNGDIGLLSHLWKNKHSTPFELAGMTVEVQAPIMVFREWHRHRIQSYSEASARYGPLPANDYLPTAERCMIAAGKNKQAASLTGSNELTDVAANKWLWNLAQYYAAGEELYQKGLQIGIPKELARLALTVGRYSKMRASTNLRSWLHFLGLRMDQNAQYEIRMYANAIGDLISQKFPRTWSLFQETKTKVK